MTNKPLKRKPPALSHFPLITPIFVADRRSPVMPDVAQLLSISHERQKSLALIIACLVILRSHIPTSLPSLLKNYGQRLSDKELAEARQELYRKEEEWVCQSVGAISRAYHQGVFSRRHHSCTSRTNETCVFTLYIGPNRANKSLNLRQSSQTLPPPPLHRIQEILRRYPLLQTTLGSPKARIPPLAIQGSRYPRPALCVPRHADTPECCGREVGWKDREGFGQR